MKTYSEGRIELRNLPFFKRMLEKSSQFLSLVQPNEPKSLDVPWVLQELINTLGKLAIAVNLEAIRFEFWTERSVSDGGNLCSLWSVILKSVWNSVGDTFQLRYSWLWAVVKRTGTFASESKVMCLFYLILRSGVLMFRISNINQCVKNFLGLRKVE